MNYTQQIIEAIEDRIDALTTFEPLRFYFDRSKNDNIGSTGYAVIPGGMSPAESRIIKTITVTQSFQITLMNQYRNAPKGDADQQAKVKSLFDKMNDVLTDLESSKIGLNDLVLTTELESIDPPEIDEENKTVSLTMTIAVRYRNGI